MIPQIFKPEDFLLDQYGHEEHCKKAQSIFEAWLKENSKVVYAQEIEHHEHLWESKQHYPHTHQALLVCIEEIKPKECEHLTTFNQIFELFEGITYKVCRDCGKKLKAKWEVVDE